MVRFARAHGSKSSNERQPEEASSWHDLQQLRVESNTSQDSPSSPPPAEIASVKEIKARLIKAEPSESEWADLEDAPQQHTLKIKQERKLGKNKLHKTKTKQLKKETKLVRRKVTKLFENLSISKSEEVSLKENGKKLKKEKILVDQSSVSKRKKRQDKKSIKKEFETCDDMTVSDIANATTVVPSIVIDHVLTKKQKRRKKHLQVKQKNNDSDCKLAVNPVSSKAMSKRQKRNQKRLAAVLSKTGVLVPNKMAHKRRKPEGESCVMQINGQDVEVATFQGFPVRKQDADRLKELEQQMIKNDIPDEEIKKVMKAERRKAEKAWAREKKNVCFHCRKSGHNLSECPELGEESKSQEVVPQSGICYKCGSAEHTHFECRVNRTSDFRFATCFICKEQGHISNQCPDNPRGLYPKGGACKVCGDVTHLKKDCPDLVTKKEEQSITVSTISGNIEMLDEDLNNLDKQPAVKLSKKIVKF